MKKVLLSVILALGCLTALRAQEPAGDDGMRKGFVYFEDRFDWVIAPMGGNDYLDGSFPGSGPRWDGLSETYAQWLEASGWTNSNRFVYIRLGYLQVGRSTDASDIVSPKMIAFQSEEFPRVPSRAGIEPGKAVDVTVSFDIACYRGATGRRDDNTILFEVLGAGATDADGGTEIDLKVDNWNKWKNYRVTVYGATSETRFRVKSANLNREAGSSRFFFDNFKVEKQ